MSADITSGYKVSCMFYLRSSVRGFPRAYILGQNLTGAWAMKFIENVGFFFSEYFLHIMSASYTSIRLIWWKIRQLFLIVVHYCKSLWREHSVMLKKKGLIRNKLRNSSNCNLKHFYIKKNCSYHSPFTGFQLNA